MGKNKARHSLVKKKLKMSSKISNMQVNPQETLLLLMMTCSMKQRKCKIIRRIVLP